jgi:glycolate oxidase FAD binding subunit
VSEPVSDATGDRPDVVLEPGDAAETADILRGAATHGLKFMPGGHGTRATLGARTRTVDAVLSTARLSRVVAYEPGDLTLTAQCGLGLAEIDTLLAQHGQWLPLQPYRRRGTLGGLLASAADGVLDLGYGRPRDAVLGARVALSDGLTARARGRVVKNVAGYDVPRLMVGSMGSLGILLEVSLKVSPRPARQTAALLGFADVATALQAAQRVRAGQDEPVFLDVLCGACEPQLALGFDGSDERVDGCRRRAVEAAQSAGSTGLLELDGEECVTLRRRLDDPVAHLLPGSHDSDAPDAPAAVIRWSGRPTDLAPWLTASLDCAEQAGVPLRADARPGLGLAFLGVGPADHPAFTATLRTLLDGARCNGAAVLLAGPDALRADADLVWGPPPPDMDLMRRTQQALDPQGVFACGRFVGGL